MDLQKGFVPVVKLLVAGLLVLGALFIPIPRYQNGGCLEIDIDPPRCYSAGWKLGPSLWSQISGNSEKTVSYSTAPTPKPDPSNSASQTPPPDGCKKTGCNREICADKDMPSPCEALLKYGCYSKTRCERQADGNCGWTQTEELKECLNKYKN